MSHDPLWILFAFAILSECLILIILYLKIVAFKDRWGHWPWRSNAAIERHRARQSPEREGDD